MGNWHLNDGYHLNEEDFRLAEFSFEGDAMLDVSFDVFSELEAEFFISSDWEYTHSVALDLLPMFPEKFHSSQILIDFVKELSIQVGSWLTSTRDITQLLNPNTITSIKYLRLLGDLIAVDFPDEDDSSQTEIKKTLQQAVDWYKIKGTYKAIQIAAAISSFTINLYDMYTNDYENFYLTDWFVGDEDENPPGFDSTYYKSPHFGLEVVLGQLFTDDSSLYLFQSGAIDTMIERIEKIRPVHTVPHYILKLNPKTDEFGNVVEVENYTYARITSNWEISQKYFDDQSSSGSWDFDSGSVYFDQNNTSFIKSIDKWVFGTGNYLNDLSDPSFEIEEPALTGSIDSDNITIDSEKITFEFLVPKSASQLGLTELGLYIEGSPDTPMMYATFPKIDKTTKTEIRVVFEVYKKDLS